MKINPSMAIASLFRMTKMMISKMNVLGSLFTVA